MEGTDVIISAYATPPEQSYRAQAQDTSLFRAAPLIVDVPFQTRAGEWSASAAFDRSAEELLAQGNYKSILRPLLARQRGYTIRSVTLTGFSAGNQFLKRVLQLPGDAALLDGVISLDGMVFNNNWNGTAIIPAELTPWMNFAQLAAQNQRLFVCSHTHIAAPSTQITSTAEAADALMYALADKVGGERAVPNVQLDSGALVAGPPPPTVTMTGYRETASGRVPIVKTWDTMPMPDIAAIGNAWAFDYGGNNESDHIFQARYAQRAIWRALLAPRLNGDVHCATDLQGLGQEDGDVPASCAPSKLVLPPGAITMESPWPTLGAAVAGLVLGAGVGYAVGHWRTP
jgi:hypothetical protein